MEPSPEDQNEILCNFSYSFHLVKQEDYYYYYYCLKYSAQPASTAVFSVWTFRMSGTIFAQLANKLSFSVPSDLFLRITLSKCLVLKSHRRVFEHPRVPFLRCSWPLILRSGCFCETLLRYRVCQVVWSTLALSIPIRMLQIKVLEGGMAGLIRVTRHPCWSNIFWGCPWRNAMFWQPWENLQRIKMSSLRYISHTLYDCMLSGRITIMYSILTAFQNLLVPPNLRCYLFIHFQAFGKHTILFGVVQSDLMAFHLMWWRLWAAAVWVKAAWCGLYADDAPGRWL